MNLTSTNSFGKYLCMALLVAFNPLIALPQASSALSLAQAKALALQNHPSIASADLRAQASTELTREARSAYYPTVAGNLTGTMAADSGTATAAGGLTTSSISSRVAGGGTLLQMVTDFGRTNALVRTTQFRAKAQGQLAQQTREEILMDVTQGYFGVLASEAVLKAAQEALSTRQVTLRQVTALQLSQLKSTLDVSFAQVLESEAELAVYRADNTVHEARAQLGAALGQRQTVDQPLEDESLPAPLDTDAESFVALAERQRPDLLAQDANRSAAHEYAKAEKDLRNPTINLLGAAGEIPEHDHTLRDNYAAAGLNLNVPIFTGGLFKARRDEAALQAQAEDKDFENLENQVAAEVRNAWFEANNAYRDLDVTARLVDQARNALRLAQASYDNGLGGIVELNEAQVSETSAEITAASAKYDYLAKRALLDYAVGALR
jgi:outer membrane protein